MKEYELFLLEREDSYGDIYYQRVRGYDPYVPAHFEVSNLNECPEDATIGRELFTAYDYIKAVQLGFQIAKHGYDRIVFTEVDKYPNEGRILP